jgi:ABC-type Na+ efflux pump permease subunit
VPGDEEFRSHPRRLSVSVPEGYAGLTEAVLAGRQVRLRFEHDAEGNALAFDRVRVARAVYPIVGDLAVLARRNEPVGADALHRLAAVPRTLLLDVSTAGRREEAPVGFAQAVPGTMVMFTMLVLLTSGAIMLVVERREGLLRRLAAAPISRGEIVLGKWTARMALALVQIAFAMVVGTALFGVNWGDAIGMVAVVLVAWAAFNASLAILVGSVTRTEGQTAGIGVVSTMALAALGGCWWPIEVAPGWMQSLALFLPTGWTMDAMHKLVSFNHPAAAVVPHVLGLAMGSAAVGWLGARVFRYDA